jgi:hypothetical protein
MPVTGDEAARAADAVGKDGAATDAAPYRAPSAALSERHNETTGFMNRSACWTSAVRPGLHWALREFGLPRERAEMGNEWLLDRDAVICPLVYGRFRKTLNEIGEATGVATHGAVPARLACWRLFIIRRLPAQASQRRRAAQR